MNIHFLYPGFLWALASLAIPIVIHLFHFRRYRRVYFSNMELLRSVNKDKRPRTRLRHLLILLARLLALAAIVLAFAQPFIPTGKDLQRGQMGHVGIYIDNSFSMEAENAQGQLLEQAKKTAFRIASSYKKGTRFYLITNDYEPQHSQAADANKLSDMIARVEASPVGRKISDIALYYSTLDQNQEASRNLFVLSDFQTSMANPGQADLTENMHLHLISLPNREASNMYIDSCWFATPGRKRGQPEELTVSIVNNSEEGFQEIPLKLYLGDTLKAVASFNISAHAKEFVSLNYITTKTGAIHGRLEISDYPVTYDNTLFFSYTLSARARVLDIGTGEKSPVPRAMFTGDQLTTYEDMHIERLDYSKLNNYHFIILNEAKGISSGLSDAMLRYVENGGALLIVPSGEGLTGYPALMTRLGFGAYGQVDTSARRLAGIEYQDELYAQAFRKQSERPDLPGIGLSYRTQTSPGERTLLRFEDGQPALSMLRKGRGKCYRFTMPFSHPGNALARHMIIAPTLYNMALMSQSSGQLYSTIGDDPYVSLENIQRQDDQPIRIQSANGQHEFIPRAQPKGGKIMLYTEGKPHEAGNYLALQGQDTLAALAFNYSRDESLMDFADEEELLELIEKNPKAGQINMHTPKEGRMQLAIDELERGKALWRYFLLLALLMLAAETALVRLWRH